MSRELGRAVEHAHGVLGRDDREGLAHVRVGDRVVVPVEPHVRRLSGDHGADHVRGCRVRRQREEHDALFDERVAHRSTLEITGHEASALDLVEPRRELLVEILDGTKRSGLEEGLAQVAHATLDAPLLVATRDGARLGGEVVVPGELEDARVEADEFAAALEDGALQVVVQDRPRHAAERFERGDVPAQEALGRLVEVEAGEQRARPREHHEEAREAALRAADLDGAEGRPVDLRLLASKHTEPQEGLGDARP